MQGFGIRVRVSVLWRHALDRDDVRPAGRLFGRGLVLRRHDRPRWTTPSGSISRILEPGPRVVATTSFESGDQCGDSHVISADPLMTAPLLPSGRDTTTSGKPAFGPWRYTIRLPSADHDAPYSRSGVFVIWRTTGSPSVPAPSTAIVYRSRSSSEGPPLTSNVVPSGDQANPVPPCCIDPPMTGKDTSSRMFEPSASMTASVSASGSIKRNAICRPSGENTGAAASRSGPICLAGAEASARR